MSWIIFRCDASLLIGSGHVIRCRTLARELVSRGHVAVFICRSQPGDFCEVLESEFQVLRLESNPNRSLVDDTKSHITGDIYSHWLGCDQSSDAAESIQALNAAGITQCDWLVVDHYGINSEWERIMLNEIRLMIKSDVKLLVIDDLANRRHNAHILVDQTYHKPMKISRYAGLVSDECKVLLGPHYALLGAEYGQLHAESKQRKKLDRIIIYFGGVDPCGYTLKTLELLSRDEFTGIDVDVVVGKQSRNLDKIVRRAQARRATYIHQYVDSLAHLLSKADLAIGAGGASIWERFCLRLPSLVVSLSDNQHQTVQPLIEAGFLLPISDCEDFPERNLTNALRSCMKDLGSMKTGYSLVDGYGVKRVCESMFRRDDHIILREVQERDEALLLRWANDPQVRLNSFSPDEIKSSDHHYWLQKGLKNEDRLHYIAFNSFQCPIGQVRLDRERSSGEVRIDFSIDSAYRGQGLGSEILMKAIEGMCTHWTEPLELVADVIDTNIASQRCFERLGFSQVLDADSSLNIRRYKADCHAYRSLASSKVASL